jgi:hypothetical protein
MATTAADLYRKTRSVRAVMRKYSCAFERAKELILDSGGELLPTRRKSKLTKAEIVERYKTKSVCEIAKANGTSNSIVLRVLKEFGVPMRRQGHNLIRVVPITHGHCQQARRFGMTPYRYVRLMAIVTLGGKCVRCGETDLYVLDINHINGVNAPQRNKSRRRTDAKYAEHCRILAGGDFPHLEVTCCNCNRRHEVDRGNIPQIPQEFLCLHKSRLQSSASVTPLSTVKKSRDG